MIQISIDLNGASLNLSQEDFRQWLEIFVNGCVNLGLRYVNLHAAGLAYFTGDLLGKEMGLIQIQYTQIQKWIPDKRLEVDFASLIDLLFLIYKEEIQIIDAYEGYYEKGRTTPAKRRRLSRKLEKLMSSSSMFVPEEVKHIAIKAFEQRNKLEQLRDRIHESLIY